MLQRYGLLLSPNFSLIALAAVVVPLRLANGVLGRKVYEYVTVGAVSMRCPPATASACCRTSR